MPAEATVAAILIVESIENAVVVVVHRGGCSSCVVVSRDHAHVCARMCERL